MFHLFNKAYLQFDSSLSAYDERIVISKAVGYPTDDPVGDIKPLLAVGPTVSDLIGAGKQFDTYLSFFKYIMDHTGLTGQRLIVYCDREAFVELFVAWHKIILECKTHHMVWRIWCHYIQKESYLSAVTNRISHVQFNTIKLSTWNEADFQTAFAKVEVQKDRQWVAESLTKLGVEYLLSSHVAQSVPAVKDALKNKMLALANRAIQGELFEAKLQLITATHTKKLQDIVGVPVDGAGTVFSHPVLSVFNDPNLWNDGSIMVPSNGSSALRIDQINAQQMQRLMDGFIMVRTQLQDQPLDCIGVSKIKWLSWVVNNNITDVELNTQLMDLDYNAIEMSDPNDLAMLNILFIDWVLKQHRTNQAANIQDAVLSI